MTGWAAKVLALALALGGDGPPQCPPELFRITRSTNANVVLYEAHEASSGTLDSAAPVRAVWLMLAEDGRREELTGLEWRLAYGVEVRRPAEPAAAVVTLRSQPRRPVAIRQREGCFVASTPIGGREARLRSIHVVVGRGLWPTVRSVELFGVDLETGEELRESVASAP